MLSCRSFCANVAASAYPIHRFLYLRRTFDVNFRRFGASCNHSSSSSSISSDMNFSPSINRGIRSFFAGFLLGAVRRSSETKPIPVFTAPPSAGASADWGPLCSVYTHFTTQPSCWFCALTSLLYRYRTVVHVETFVEQHYNQQRSPPFSSPFHCKNVY